MKVTREQYNKWNAQAKNGFTLDCECLVVWGEKTLRYKRETPSGVIIELTINYYPEYERVTNEYGSSYNRETGKFLPSLTVRHWTPTTTGFYSSSGLPSHEVIGEAQDKKKYNILCKLSGEIDIESRIKQELEKYPYLMGEKVKPLY